MPYIGDAGALAASNTRIITGHMFPNPFASLIIVSTRLIGGHHLDGALPQRPDHALLFTQAPWIILLPSFALTLLCSASTCPETPCAMSWTPACVARKACL